jgi:hypothetical protein
MEEKNAPNKGAPAVAPAEATIAESSADTDVNICDSPVRPADNVSALTKSDFENLRKICCDAKLDISTACSGQPFEVLTTSVVSRNQKATKTMLFDNLKKLIKLCERMCNREIRAPQPTAPVVVDNSSIKDYFSKVEASLFSVEACVDTHNTKMQSMLTQLANLQSDVSKLSSTPPRSTNGDGHEPPADNHPPAAPQHQSHPATPTGVKNIEARVHTFLDSETHQELASYLANCKFSNENGHGVAAFGERYHYTGAKAKSAPTTELPEVLVEVMKSVSNHCNYEMNSVLINHYPAGEDSYLPEHSDNEGSIDPDSFICTLSVGATRVLTFKEISTGVETPLIVEDNSLYYMSRNSQNFFTHRIDKASGGQQSILHVSELLEPGTSMTSPDKASGAGDRYSLTFRCVGMKFRRSTIIIGHSQTEDFAFGDGIGTFGRGLPGKRVKAGQVKHIRPTDCMSYANVVIVCGINDLREGQYLKTCDIDVNKTFSVFKDKISEICRIKKNINVFICPILPSKSYIYHARAVKFNKLIYSDIICQGYYRCSILDVSSFCDSSYRSDLLDSSYSRGDLVHLNTRGTRKLATVIKDSIFRKYNSGKGSRIDSVKPYSAALQDGPPGSGTPNPS